MARSPSQSTAQQSSQKKLVSCCDKNKIAERAELKRADGKTLHEAVDTSAVSLWLVPEVWPIAGEQLFGPG